MSARLFIDVTHTWHSGANTGIQRVVRNLADWGPRLAAEIDPDFTVQPVVWAGLGYVPVDEVGTEPSWLYRWHARRRGNGSPEPTGEESAEARARSPLSFWRRAPRQAASFLGAPRSRRVRLRRGDRLLLADAFWHHPHQWSAIDRWRGSGVEVTALLYDLIPHRLPETFPARVVRSFREYLTTVLPRVDRIVTISEATAADLRAFVEEEQLTGVPEAVPFTLGVDFAEAVATEPSAEVEAAIAEAEAPTALIVGSIEPRKDHRTLLRAFEAEWARGGHGSLWIVGGTGWESDAFLAELANHPERGKRLRHLTGVSDGDLDRLYRHATVTVCPSKLEGFGLPVIEAVTRGCPVLASDIPSHREIAARGDGVEEACGFFAVGDGSDLARQLFAQERRQRPQGLRWPTWSDATAELLETLQADIVEPKHGVRR